MLKQCGYILFLVCVCLNITGCWDYKDIENRGYVLGVSIDYADPKPKGEYDLDKSFATAGERKYRVTFEMPKFIKSEQTKESSQGSKNLLWTGEAESMFAITRSMGQKVYFAPFFEDIQSIVISEAVARNERLSGVLDFWLRDPEMRRRLYLFIAPGRAEDILKVKIQVEEPNSMFLNKLVRNMDRVPYFPGKAEIGRIHEAMISDMSFVIPEVVTDGQDIKIEKGAVFNRQQKMVGELNEFEVIGGKFLRRTIKQGVYQVPNPADPGKIAVFELFETDLKVVPKLENDQLRFSVKAEVVGNLGEQAAGSKVDTLDMNFVKAVEQALSDQFERYVRASYSKQQQLNADVCELGSLVRRQHPEYWEKIKEHWDEEIFPQVPLDVDIKVRIRRPVLMR